MLNTSNYARTESGVDIPPYAHSDNRVETIKPRPSIERKAISLEAMYHGSSQEALGDLGITRIVIPTSISSEVAASMTVYKDVRDQGRSGASVKEEWKVTPDKSYFAGQKYVVEQQPHIVKDNGDPVANWAEFSLIAKFQENGLPYANAIWQPQTEQHSSRLLIQHLGHTSLSKHIYQGNYRFNTDQSGVINFDSINDIYQKLVDTAIGVEKVCGDWANSELGKPMAEYLQQQRISKLADSMGTSRKFAHEQGYTLKLLQHMPGATQEHFELLKPVGDLMQEAEDKYGTWSVGVHPQNVMMTGKDEKDLAITLVDANNLKHGSGLEFDVLLLDAYTPIKTGFGFAPGDMTFNERNGPRQGKATTLYSFTEKVQWEGYIAELREKSLGKKINKIDYIEKYSVAKFWTNMILAQKALKDIATANNFHQIFHAVHEYHHFRQEANFGLYSASRVFPSIDYETINSKLGDLLGHAENAVITDSLVHRTDEWSQRDWFPKDMEGVCV